MVTDAPVRPAPKTPPTSLFFPTDFLAELDQAAAHGHNTRSEFVRAAVRHYIRFLRMNGDLPAQPSQKAS